MDAGLRYHGSRWSPAMRSAFPTVHAVALLIALPFPAALAQQRLSLSFLVRLLHSLQHAGLSRRTLVNGKVPHSTSSQPSLDHDDGTAVPNAWLGQAA